MVKDEFEAGCTYINHTIEPIHIYKELRKTLYILHTIRNITDSIA
jgi:hypothetical protein